MTNIEAYLQQKQQGKKLCLGEEMKYEAFRLATFKKWPRQACVNPTLLASAGFSYTGYRDEVLCFACRGRIKEWQICENPKDEHARYFPSCPFIRGVSDNVSMSVSTLPGFTNSEILDVKPNHRPFLESTNFTSPHRPHGILVHHADISVQSSEVKVFESNNAKNPPVTMESINSSLSTMSATDRPDAVSLQTNFNDNLDFWDVDQRLISFRNFPPYSPVRPSDLAQAGFYYVNRDDVVQCFMCNGRIRNWEQGDIPLQEHRRFYPNCPYLEQLDYENRFNRGQSNTNNVRNPPNSRQSSNQLPLSNYIPDDDNPIVTERAKHMQFAIEGKRLATFDTWPQNKTQIPEEMAEAGFFYAGFNDNVKCFFCDGGLRNWDPPDKPWEEHARWFPKCGYVKQCKGLAYIKLFAHKKKTDTNMTNHLLNGTGVPSRTAEAYMDSAAVKAVLEIDYSRELVKKAVEKVIQNTAMNTTPVIDAQTIMDIVFELEEAATNVKETNDLENTNNVDVIVEATQSVNKLQLQAKSTSTEEAKASEEKDKSSSTEDEASHIKAELESLKELQQCKICFERQKDILLLPCAHLCCCSQCAPALRNCPMCRTPIKGTVKTFMP